MYNKYYGVIVKYFLDFDLPKNLIATQPSPNREQDRMIIFQDDQITHDDFVNISQYLKEGDIIVVNNSKVFKARLDIKAIDKDFESELLLINQEDPKTWTAMIKKAKRFKTGIQLKNGLKAQIVDILDDGLRRIVFEKNFSPADADSIGQIPLPPYIIDERKKRGEDTYTSNDDERYQTLFAKYYGSVAAPTASLRFSEQIIQELTQKGVIFKEITLHVGIGTFKPMDTDPDKFEIHKEYISVSKQTMDEINIAKKNGQRIIAAGTTVCRALESVGTNSFEGDWEGWTDIFIKPGYEFKVIDGLFTNFHLPHSTLLLLVQAFIGIPQTQKIYLDALEKQYRFFSYGDGMLLLRGTSSHFNNK